MQEPDLFMELAGIAGVFVGFGALIAVRSGGPSEWQDVAQMRVVVAMGLLTVVAALAPVAVVRYDLTDHQVWAFSSALALAGWLLLIAVNARTPEWRQGWATVPGTVRWTPGEVVATAAYALYMIASFVTPIIIVLGVAPDLEAALYFTYVVLILVGGSGWTLMALVFSQRVPQTASDPAALPASGGSSA